MVLYVFRKGSQHLKYLILMDNHDKFLVVSGVFWGVMIPQTPIGAIFW